MNEYHENLIKSALVNFGESESRIDDVEICENGSAYLGLTQLLPPRSLWDGPYGTKRNNDRTFENSNGIFDEYGRKIERVNLCQCDLCEVYMHKRDKLGRLYCEICNRLWVPLTRS